MVCAGGGVVGLDAGIDLAYLQQQLGPTSLSTTAIYL